MSKARRWSRAALACATLTVACEQSGREELPWLEEEVPLALEDALLYVGHAGGDGAAAILVDLARSEPKVRIEELSGG